jgi:hypothetical protein
MNHVRSSILTVILAVGTASVTGAQATRHPDRRFVDQSIPVTTTVRLSGSRSATAIALRNPAVATIGREDGPQHSIFGDITSAAVTARGNVVVVDRKTQDVRLFDAHGNFLQRLGRPGQGPGEFRAPHSVLVTPSDEIWIADMQRRLTVFAPSPDGYKLARTIPTSAIGIRSMCLLGDDLIANGIAMGDPYAIRVLDAQARPLRSFGRIYSSPNALLNVQFSEESFVACDAPNDLIIYASQAALGEIRAYKRDGTAVWRVAVEDLRTNVITESDGGISVKQSPDGAHALVSLNVVPRIGIVVQYGFRSFEQMRAKEPASNIITVIIDPATGAAAVSPSALPQLGAVSGTRVIAFFEDPAPRLEIREVRRP